MNRDLNDGAAADHADIADDAVLLFHEIPDLIEHRGREDSGCIGRGVDECSAFFARHFVVAVHEVEQEGTTILRRGRVIARFLVLACYGAYRGPYQAVGHAGAKLCGCGGSCLQLVAAFFNCIHLGGECGDLSSVSAAEFFLDCGHALIQLVAVHG